MGTIFKTQDWLRIKLSYTANISASIASVVIKYKTPTGTIGEFAATHVPAEKYVYYDLPQGSPLGSITTERTKWRFWIGATATDGRYAPGEVVTELVKEEGKT